MSVKQTLLYIKVITCFMIFCILAGGALSEGVFSILLLVFAYNSLKEERSVRDILYRKYIERAFFVLVFFLFMQIFPFPVIILEKLSPWVFDLIRKSGEVKFHSVSAIPLTSFFAITGLIVSVVFAASFFMIRLGKEDCKELLLFIQYLFSGAFIFTATGACLTDSFLLSRAADNFKIFVIILLPLNLMSLFHGMYKVRKSGAAMSVKTEEKKSFLCLLAMFVVNLAFLMIFSSVTDFITVAAVLFTASLLGFYLKQQRRKRTFYKPFFIITAGLILIFTVNVIGFTSLSEHQGDILPVISSAPFWGTGAGTGAFISNASLTGDKPVLHSLNGDLFRIWLELGIPGFLVFLSLVCFAGISLYRMWKKRRHPEIRMLAGALILVFIAGMNVSVYHSFNPGYVMISLFVILYVIALNLSVYKKEF